jgi:hypothetical protein
LSAALRTRGKTCFSEAIGKRSLVNKVNNKMMQSL